MGWEPWARLGLGIAGYALTGSPIGFVAGSYLGSVIFPTDYETEMPTVGEYQMQSSAIGIPIPIVLGTSKIPGNIVWMGDLESYEIKHSAGGGKGGGGEQEQTEIKYRRSFLIAICEGPATVLRMWQDKNLKYADSTFDFSGYGSKYEAGGFFAKEIAKVISSPPPVTFYNGDDNSGISTLIGESYAEYSNVCLAYFEDYELGNTQRIPNFIFEVASGAIAETPGKTAIYTLAQLQAMNDDVTADYELMNNIDASDTSTWNGGAGWVPVGNSGNHFTGSFDGRGFSISNLFINRSTVFDYRQAMFGQTENAVIENINLVDVNITGGGGFAGSLIGAATGSGGGSTTITKCFASGTIVAGAQSGGLIGGESGGGDVICSQCGADVDINPMPAKWLIWCGGFAGNNIGSFTDCYATGDLGAGGGANTYDGGFIGSTNNSTTFTNCYSSGLVPSAANCGGFVGYHALGAGPTFTNCYWDVTTSQETWGCGDAGGEQHAGLTGKSTAQMKQQATYQNWDFTIPIWKITEGVTRAYIEPTTPAGLVAGDMNFAEMIKYLLINEKCGNYEESDLITVDFDSIITYCNDKDLRGSLVITQQKPLPDWIAYICSHFQGYFYEIGGKIGLNCYRDQASVLSLVQDDLLRDGDEPPVHVTKRQYSSTFNRLEATWTNRSNDYKTGVVPAFDRIDQREAGQVRTKTLDLRVIHNKELAAKMTWRIFIDQIYRFSQYSFKLGYKSMLLEVGDVIDVTDGYKLAAKQMRVLSISEEKDGRRALISAIEDISGLYPTLEYSIQESETEGDSIIDLTDGTIAFRENYIDNRLFLSITPGGAQCNGFYIYRSYDDESYDLVGKAAIGEVTGGEANSTGTIQSNLPAYTAIVHRKDDAFDVSIGTITDLDTAIADNDFFNNRKIARIGTEIIGYKTCVESATAGIWRVSNLIRGLFGTEAVAHVPGETFKTLNVDFVYTLREEDIGKTIYFKIVSYYADEIQLVSGVSAQSHVVSGKYMKPLPVSLMRINRREGLSTYKTVDVTLDWYFCSKTSGFGRGGYGNALWGAYEKDILLERLKVELEEEDGTPIVDGNYELTDYGEPVQLEILEVDRNSKNPVRVKITPGSHLWSDSTRDILIEKI